MPLIYGLLNYVKSSGIVPVVSPISRGRKRECPTMLMPILRQAKLAKKMQGLAIWCLFSDVPGVKIDGCG